MTWYRMVTTVEFSEGLDAHWRHGEWDGVPRVAVGVENRTDRLRALGNALVPQIAEWIGGRIMEWENEWAVAA